MEPANLLISIDNAAVCIENALQQILKPYPVGIYIKGNELPSIVPNDYFYRVDRISRGKVTEKQVKSIEDIEGNIFNEDGEIVINDRVSNSKDRLLSTLPTVPAYGREIARAVIKDILDYMQIYKNIGLDHHNLEAVFERVISPHYQNTKTFKQFCDIVQQHTQDYIYEEIQRFVGTKTWDILLVKFDRDTVRIENKGDYRIHRYMEEHGHEHGTRHQS